MIGRAAVFILVAGIRAFAAHGTDVSICLDGNSDLSPASLTFAENKASALYAVLAVRLRWHAGASCRNSHDMVRITIADRAPQNAPAGALAYAYPYERKHVLVMYDRVRRLTCDCQQNPALGYVLAHEIGHILEGVSRHSAGGILKAHWERADYEAMLDGSLRFAPEDVSLIHMGLNELLARR